MAKLRSARVSADGQRYFDAMTAAYHDRVVDTGESGKAIYWQIEHIPGTTRVLAMCFLYKELNWLRVCSSIDAGRQVVVEWEELVRSGRIR